jgi:hypothetical protein
MYPDAAIDGPRHRPNGPKLHLRICSSPTLSARERIVCFSPFTAPPSCPHRCTHVLARQRHRGALHRVCSSVTTPPCHCARPTVVLSLHHAPAPSSAILPLYRAICPLPRVFSTVPASSTGVTFSTGVARHFAASSFASTSLQSS